MNLEKFLFNLKKYVGKVEKNEFKIKIEVNSAEINENGIRFLYFLLNNYEDYYFITIENLPFCLMPDAVEHIIYKINDMTTYYYDEICKYCDFAKSCIGWQEFSNIERKKILPLKYIPKEIIIEITTYCNLNCRACTLDRSKSLDVKLEKVKRIVDECKSLGIKAVRFTGGEPLFNSEINKMLYYAKRNKFYVLLNTNATVINNSILKLLEKTVDNILISLQGFSQKTDRTLTGSNIIDYEEKISNIIKLKSKIPIVRIGTVICKTLINNFEKYYSLLKRLGIAYWELYRPIIKNKDDEFNISKKDIIKIMRNLLDLKKRGMKVKIANPVPFCISKDMDLSLATLLGAIADDGHSRIVWDGKGYFKPSYFINTNLGYTIKDAWYNPFLKKLQSLDYLPLKCKKCEYLRWCKGGGRSFADIRYDSPFLKDPLMR